MPYSLRMSARRSTSPCRRGEKGHAVAGFHQRAGLGDGHLHVAVKGHGRARGDVRLAASSPEPDQPISSSSSDELRDRRGLALQFLPAEEDPVGIVGRRAARSAPAASRSRSAAAAPAPARPRPRSGGPAARRPTHCAGRTIGASSSQPGNGSPGGGRSRPGMSACAHQFAQLGQQTRATSDIPSAAAACSLRSSGRSAATPRRSGGWTPPGRRTGRCARAWRLPGKRRRGCRRAPSTRPPSRPARAARSRCSPGARPLRRAAIRRRRCSLSASCR